MIDFRDRIKNLKIGTSFRFFLENRLAVHVERSSNVRYSIFVIDADGAYSYRFTTKEQTLAKLIDMTGSDCVRIA